MDLFAPIFAAATLLTMWFVAKASRSISSSDSCAQASSAWQLPLLEVGLALAVFAILATIGVASYDGYTLRKRVAEASNLLAYAQSSVDDLRVETSSTEAQGHLATAGMHIERATEFTRGASSRSVTTEQLAEFLTILSSAEVQLAEAAVVDPNLAHTEDYGQLPSNLERVKHAIEPIAKGNQVPGTTNDPALWRKPVFMLGGIFLVAVFGVVIFVGMRHGDSKPQLAKRWMRVYLEPIVAVFAILAGLVLAMDATLDHTTSLWGAGMAGSGIGFWLKSAT